MSPQQLRHRSPASPEGRAALLHALAHIEFNAVNLALDIIWRFAGMPTAFYLDWLRVAREEAYHFELLNQRLASLGHVWRFPAHNGLWDMAERTRGDLLARLALVPRTLEARGLDASPMIRDKLNSVGDAESAAVLDIILADEIGHVAIGNRWFKHLCAQQGRDPVAATRNWRIARRASPARSVQSGSAPRRRFRRNRTGGFAGRFSNPVIMRSNRMKPAHPVTPSRRASHDPARCCWPPRWPLRCPPCPPWRPTASTAAWPGCVRRR